MRVYTTTSIGKLHIGWLENGPEASMCFCTLLLHLLMYLPGYGIERAVGPLLKSAQKQRLFSVHQDYLQQKKSFGGALGRLILD